MEKYRIAATAATSVLPKAAHELDIVAGLSAIPGGTAIAERILPQGLFQTAPAVPSIPM